MELTLDSINRGEDRWIQANGLDLHYVNYGKSGKRPILLLHGLQDCARLWESFAMSLAEQYHVIALDQRGHGDSPFAENYPLRKFRHALERA